MALTEPAQFTLEKKKQGYYPIVFVDCTSISKYWCTNAIGTFNSQDYEAVIKNISTVSCTIDRDGGFATVGNMTLDLTNFEDYSAWLAATPNVENTVCEFYLIFNDGTALSFAEAVKFFTGLIEKTEIDYETISISVSHKDLFIDSLVGELIAEDEYGDFQFNESIGRMKPLVYGDHRYNGPKASGSFNPLEACRMVPCVQVTTNKFVVANHALGSFSANGGLWLYSPSLGRFLEVDADDVTITNVDGSGDCIVDLTNSSYMTVYDHVFGRSIDDIVYDSAPAWSDMDNAIDKGTTTYAALSGSFSGSKKNLLIINFDEYDFNDYVKIEDIQYFTKQDWSGSGVNWYLKESYASYNAKIAYISDASAGGGTVTVTTSANHTFLAGETVQISGIYGSLLTNMTELNGFHIIQSVPAGNQFTVLLSPSGAYTGGGTAVVNPAEKLTMPTSTYGTPTNIGSAYLVNNTNIGSQITLEMTGTGTVAVKIYEFYKRIKLRVTFGSGFILCASCQGKQSGGNYIENPADVINDLVTDWTSLTSSDFDSTAFSAAQTARTNWDMDFCIIEQIPVKQIVHELSKASNIYTFWNNTNKIKLSAYVQGASAAYTADILTMSESPTVSSYSFTQTPIKKNTLRLRRTELDELCNYLRVNFNFDYVSGKYYKQIVNQNTTSQGVFGIYEKIFENRFISDNTVMGYYAANILDMFAWRMWKCSLEARLSAFNVEMGDVIDTVNFIDNGIKWLVLSYAHKPMDGQGLISIDCIEQRDNSGDTTSSTVYIFTGTTSIPGSAGGSSGFGGSGGFETIHFYGTDTGNENIRGIVYLDQYGQPVYDWRENAGGSRIERKTSYTKP